MKPPPVINGPTFPWWEKRVSSQAKRHLLSVPKLSVQMKKRQYIMFNSKQKETTDSLPHILWDLKCITNNLILNRVPKYESEFQLSFFFFWRELKLHIKKSCTVYTYLNHLVGDSPVNDKTSGMSTKKNHR